MEVIPHGDVMFKRVDGATLSNVRKMVTTELMKETFSVQGEREGHNHIVKQVMMAPLDQKYNAEYGLRPGTQAQVLVVPQEGREVTHPEHPSVKLDQGIYVAYRVRDYMGRMGD